MLPLCYGVDQAFAIRQPWAPNVETHAYSTREAHTCVSQLSSMLLVQFAQASAHALCVQMRRRPL